MRVKYFRDRGGRRSRCGTNNFGALAQRVIMRQILSNMAAQRSRKLPFFTEWSVRLLHDGWLLPAGQFLKPVTVDNEGIVVIDDLRAPVVRFTFLHPISIRPA
jgi:hypothetical protein